MPGLTSDCGPGCGIVQTDCDGSTHSAPCDGVHACHNPVHHGGLIFVVEFRCGHCGNEEKHQTHMTPKDFLKMREAGQSPQEFINQHKKFQCKSITDSN